MNASSLIPQPTDKMAFNIRNWLLIPKLSGCYVLTSGDDFILYIGLTKNLYNRFQQHINDPNKTMPTENGRAIWFHYLPAEEINLHKIERSWMNEYQRQHGVLPILNKIQSPII